LHILTEFQGKGLGTKVFKDVLVEADAMGIPVIGQVMKNNPAWRLYQRLGFIVTSETDLRYEIMRPTPRPAETGAVGEVERSVPGGEDVAPEQPKPDGMLELAMKS